MPLELSVKTDLLIFAAFCDQDESYREHIRSVLENQIGTNIPFCADATAEGMERIRFAVIRLLAEDRLKEEDVVALAKTDWRDLLIAANFGHDTRAHSAWYVDVNEHTTRR